MPPALVLLLLVCSPLLLALGFPALAAVMISLIANSTAVVFGAVGIPVLLGINAGLEGASVVDNYIAELGITYVEYFERIVIRAGIFNSIVGTLIPLFMVTCLTRYFGQRKSWGEGLAVWQFSLFAGLAFTIPSLAGRQPLESRDDKGYDRRSSCSKNIGEID